MTTHLVTFLDNLGHKAENAWDNLLGITHNDQNNSQLGYNSYPYQTNP